MELTKAGMCINIKLLQLNFNRNVLRCPAYVKSSNTGRCCTKISVSKEAHVYDFEVGYTWHIREIASDVSDGGYETSAVPHNTICEP